jgi:predicted solute-binding protein
MIKTHFEIGTTRKYHNKNMDDIKQYDQEETFSVYSSDSLTECLREFKKQGYKVNTHFIDIWETENNRTPEPIGVVDIKRMCI